MLSIHGLVIIAGDTLGASAIIDEYKSKKGSRLKIIISSESTDYSGKSKMNRHLMSIWVPEVHLEEARTKLIVGKICEIVKGTLEPIKTQDLNKGFNVISINVMYSDIRILNSCVYYPDIEGV